MKIIVSNVLVLLTVVNQVFGQDSSDFIGSWELVSIERPSDSGEWVSISGPGGGDPEGVLMYDDNGNMAVQITSVPRNVDASADSPIDMVGYVAYYGTYEVNIDSRTVTHHRKHSVDPSWGGGNSAVRYFHFDQNELTLTVAPDRSLRLIWTRLE